MGRKRHFYKIQTFYFGIESVSKDHKQSMGNHPQIYEQSMKNQWRIHARKNNATNTNKCWKWMQKEVHKSQQITVNSTPILLEEEAGTQRTSLYMCVAVSGCRCVCVPLRVCRCVYDTPSMTMHTLAASVHCLSTHPHRTHDRACNHGMDDGSRVIITHHTCPHGAKWPPSSCGRRSLGRRQQSC